MIDPRYEHAQSSNQGGDRGWHFDPAPKSRKDTPVWMVLFVLGAGIILPTLAWIMV